MSATPKPIRPLRSMKRWGLLGGLLVALGIGYGSNIKQAWRSARAEEKAYQDGRASEHDPRKGLKKVVHWGPEPQGRAPTIPATAKRAFKHMNPNPTIPVTHPIESATKVGLGAAGGAAFGLGLSGVRVVRRRRR